MSAYQVSDRHVSKVLHAAIGFGMQTGGARVAIGPDEETDTMGRIFELTLETAEEWGREIIAANLRAVCERYPDTSPGCWRPDPEPYRFPLMMAGAQLSPVETIKACHCINYQACEWKGWEGSVAQRMIESIIDLATHRLPGYDAAPWHHAAEDAARAR